MFIKFISNNFSTYQNLFKPIYFHPPSHIHSLLYPVILMQYPVLLVKINKSLPKPSALSKATAIDCSSTGAVSY